MNKAIKAKWLKALKNGKYKKTSYSLKDSSGYCCLGVLCDLYRKETGIGKWDAFYFIGKRSSSATVLPIEVQQWAGLPKKTGIKNGKGNSLAAVNDTTDTFKEVIEVIEKRA